MKNQTTNLYRIGWLDSVRMYSRIHKTNDNGFTTICKHPVHQMCHQPYGNIGMRWVIILKNDLIPRKVNGQSRYCRECFKNGGKNLPFITKEILWQNENLCIPKD